MVVRRRFPVDLVRRAVHGPFECAPSYSMSRWSGGVASTLAVATIIALAGCASAPTSPSRAALQTYVTAALDAIRQCDPDSIAGTALPRPRSQECLHQATLTLEPLYREALRSASAYRTAPYYVRLFHQQWQVVIDAAGCAPECADMRRATEQLRKYGAQLR